MPIGRLKASIWDDQVPMMAPVAPEPSVVPASVPGLRVACCIYIDASRTLYLERPSPTAVHHFNIVHLHICVSKQ
jgi:hypothetical protein